MLRFLLVFCAFWLMSFAATAASFDCAAPEHPVERVICNDAELSQLDDARAAALQERQKFVVEGDSYLITMQRRETQEMFERCGRESNIAVCVKDGLNAQIEILGNVPFPKDELKEFSTYFSIDSPQPDYDLGLKFDKPTACKRGEVCETTANISIHRKRYKNAYQVISVPFFEVTIDAPDPEQPYLCSLRSMDVPMNRDAYGCIIKFHGKEITAELLASMVEIADYNFDGFADFAFQPDNFSGFVFLYNPQEEKYSYAPALSRLFDYKSVELDAEKREIKTLLRSSYNIDETYYQVEHNMPVELRRFRQYRQGDDLVREQSVWQDGYSQIISEERSPYWSDKNYPPLLDCTKAKQPLENVICGDAELSELNEHLSDILRDLQNFTIDGDNSLLKRQSRLWAELHWDYAENDLTVNRIAEELKGFMFMLDNHPFSQSNESGEKPFIMSSNVLPAYDLALAMTNYNGCDGGVSCYSMSNLIFYNKGSDEIAQVIGLPDIQLKVVPSSEDGTCPLEPIKDFSPYKSQGCSVWFDGKEVTPQTFESLFQIADYNFDGVPDIAISMTFPANESDFFNLLRIFLYNEQDGQFYYAPGLSTLLSYKASEIDEKEQTLKIMFSSSPFYEGPAFYEEETYGVEHNQPVPLRRLSRYGEGAELIEVREIWRDGHWQDPADLNPAH